MTPDLPEALTMPTYWGVVLVTLLLVGLCVGVHYEGLERASRWMPQLSLPARVRVLVLILGLITLHTFEIWIFGIGIYFVAQHPGLGSVGSSASLKLLDAVYLSTTTYTTVGSEEFAPHGPLRLITGSEALTGFVLITWSASFTYLEMQRFWKTR